MHAFGQGLDEQGLAALERYVRFAVGVKGYGAGGVARSQNSLIRSGESGAVLRQLYLEGERLRGAAARGYDLGYLQLALGIVVSVGNDVFDLITFSILVRNGSDAELIKGIAGFFVILVYDLNVSVDRFAGDDPVGARIVLGYLIYVCAGVLVVHLAESRGSRVFAFRHGDGNSVGIRQRSGDLLVLDVKPRVVADGLDCEREGPVFNFIGVFDQLLDLKVGLGPERGHVDFVGADGDGDDLTGARINQIITESIGVFRNLRDRAGRVPEG